MNQINSARLSEIEKINQIKLKLSHIRETAIRVNPRTFILVREGKDPDLALESFRLKQLEANKREFSNELQY